jgi:hypothetical protein
VLSNRRGDESQANEGLAFEALRRAIENSDPDAMLGFYAENAQLSIVNADAPHASPFELSGKAEIAKYLRAAFGRETSHRVERAATVGEDRVTFWETSEYPDGGLVLIETTMESHDGKIVRQVDVVTKNATLDRKEEISRGPPFRTFYP